MHIMSFLSSHESQQPRGRVSQFAGLPGRGVGGCTLRTTPPYPIKPGLYSTGPTPQQTWTNVMTDRGMSAGQLTIRQIGTLDLRGALADGWRDYLAAPGFGLFFGAIFAIGGWALLTTVFFLGAAWMAYPLIIGFALIGPFAATGLYEVSRRREAGQPLVWSEILGVVLQQRHRELGWMAFVMLFIFWVWMYQIRTLVAVFFGFEGFSTLEDLVQAVFTTQNGWTFLLVGHLVGALISLTLFSLTVISCPLLLEHDVDFVTAMITSVKTVFSSPVAMLGWGCFVVVAILLAAATGFIGLLVILPILGHATWHLYRRAIGTTPPVSQRGT